MLPESVESVGSNAFGGREGEELTVTLSSQTPPDWGEADSTDGLVIYVPDSQGDTVYREYLDAWQGWLGEHPEEILKTKDGAENRVLQTGEEEQELTGEIVSEEPEEEEPKEDSEEEPDGAETGGTGPGEANQGRVFRKNQSRENRRRMERNLESRSRMSRNRMERNRKTRHGWIRARDRGN